MVHIELRTSDNYFDIGKDRKFSDPDIYKTYLEKQELKKQLEAIGEQSSIEFLEEALKEIPKAESSIAFESRSYFEESVGLPEIGQILIETYSDPGVALLGRVKE